MTLTKFSFFIWPLMRYVLCVLFCTTAALPSELIRHTYRPPNYETPISALDQDFTPNDLFFQRSHLAGIFKVDTKSWKLEVGGDGSQTPVAFTLADLQDPKKFEQVTLAAVAVCSGNRRGLFDPHVPGVQWGHGAMGNATWTGVRLRDVLARAGIKSSTVEVVFDGADIPVSSKTPDFQKSLPVAKALHPDTLIAFAMNGQPLPEAQGFPARLVVPGWTATYWIKQLISIKAMTKPFDGYWMQKAYRVPKGAFPTVEAAASWQANETDVPITEIIVNSLITKPAAGVIAKKGGTITISGFAWDAGHGIAKVEVSLDAGKTWNAANLDKDLGSYSWRRFFYKFKPKKTGPVTALSKATNLKGHTQPEVLVFNGAGYHHNVPQGLSAKQNLVSESPTEDVKLKFAADLNKIEATCGMCHSLDYIKMNSPFLDRQGWERVVNKMMKAYGAPVETKDVPVIVDYLTKNYGHF